MRILRRLAVTVTCVLFAGGALGIEPPDASAYDYAQNGSFENGTDGWRAAPGVAFSTVGADIVPPIDGLYSARVTLGQIPVQIRQSVYAGVPAGAYHLSVYARSSSPAAQMFADVSSTDPRGGNSHTSVTSPDRVWVPIVLDVLVTQTSDLSVSLGGSGATGDFAYFDAMRFEGPAPSIATPTASAPAAASTTASNETRTPLPSKTVPVTRTPTPTKTATAVYEPGAELLNAGFEETDASGNLIAWRRYGGSLSAATSPVHGGNHAGRLESASASTKWLYQTVIVEPGATYAFGAWVLDDDPNVASASLRISWYASPDSSGGATGASDSTARIESRASAYIHLTTGGVRAPDVAHSARLRVLLAPASDAPAAIYVDDASFGPSTLAEQTPIPTEAPADKSATPNAVTGALGAKDRRASRGHDTANAGTAASAGLVINEVLYDPDVEGNDAEGEWVELYNSGPDPVNLDGWTLSDNAASDVLPVAVVEPGQFAVVAASDSFRAAYPDYDGALAVLGARIGNSLGNDGDRLVLKSPAGVIVDAISWGADLSALNPAVGDVPAGHSIERRVPGLDTDTAADFVDNDRPSPGSPFESAAAHSERRNADAPTVDILPPPAAGAGRWLPWAIAAGAGAVLLAGLARQSAPSVRRYLGRLRRPSDGR